MPFGVRSSSAAPSLPRNSGGSAAPVAAEPLMSLKEHFGKAEETVSKFVSFPLEATTLGSGSHIFVRSFALGL